MDPVLYWTIVAAIIGAVGALLGWLATNRQSKTGAKDSAAKIDPALDQRNRRVLLEKVELSWVKGVLENSLHGAVLIEFDLEERKEAVEHPWEMELHRTGQVNRALSPEVKMADVFDEVGQNLLILGEPGSGKTTMLLELAREMIGRAKNNEFPYTPTVFTLSSWRGPDQPIADWLVEELRLKYLIPRQIAEGWVNNDALLLLLDGLDEVAEGRRDDCVKALNAFREAHLMPLVVCSRVADYERLSTRLNLESAILIKPLTPEKIDEYLSQGEFDLGGVRATLQYDEALQKLAETPLMLSIMTLAYQGKPAVELQLLKTVGDHRQHLFETYIERMFERRGGAQPYSKEQTTRWLAWLAQKMVEHDQTEFLLEGLQPQWLETERQKWAMRLLVGLPGVLFVGLLTGLSAGSFGRLLVGLFGGLLVGLFMGRDALDHIRIADTLGWSWKMARMGLKDGLIFGLIFGLTVGLTVGLPGGLFVGLLFGLSVVLGAGLSGGLLTGLLGGLKSAELRIIPNQGMWQTGKNVLIIGLIIGLFGGLLAGLFGGLLAGLFGGLLAELFGRLIVAGLFAGLLVGLFAGLGAVGIGFIQHFSLRFILWRSGQLPWHLVSFLDYATQLIFLRRVGGRYIFVHRLLMEHFAALGQENK